MVEYDKGLQPGDWVKAIYGYLQTYRGTVVSINKQSQIATVRFDIFGRQQPVDVELKHLRKMLTS